jgi:hypothetical protein
VHAFAHMCLRFEVLDDCSVLMVWGHDSMWNYPSNQYFPATTSFSILPVSWATINANFTFKLYSDVAVWFAFLVGVALLATTSHFVPAVRHVLHTRVRVSSSCLSSKSVVASWFGMFPFGATVGELLMLIAISCLYAFWASYWPGFLYNRITGDDQGDGSGETLLNVNIAARTVGHCAYVSILFFFFFFFSMSVRWRQWKRFDFSRAH